MRRRRPSVGSISAAALALSLLGASHGAQGLTQKTWIAFPERTVTTMAFRGNEIGGELYLGINEGRDGNIYLRGARASYRLRGMRGDYVVLPRMHCRFADILQPERICDNDPLAEVKAPMRVEDGIPIADSLTAKFPTRDGVWFVYAHSAFVGWRGLDGSESIRKIPEATSIQQAIVFDGRLAVYSDQGSIYVLRSSDRKSLRILSGKVFKLDSPMSVQANRLWIATATALIQIDTNLRSKTYHDTLPGVVAEMQDGTLAILQTPAFAPGRLVTVIKPSGRKQTFPLPMPLADQVIVDHRNRLWFFAPIIHAAAVVS